MFEKHLGEIFEQLWIFGAKESTCDLIHHLLQLRNLVVVCHSVISNKEQVRKVGFCSIKLLIKDQSL